MNTPEQRRVHQILSILLIVVGLVLMIGKIYADSEPGLIPILLVLAGAARYVAARVRAHHGPPA